MNRPVGKRYSILGKFFTLMPYGSELLTPDAYYWTVASRILIFIMATVESVSWGYFGSLFYHGNLKYLSGVAAGVAIFLVIWLVDATLMTLDTSRILYEMAVYKQVQQEYGGFIPLNLKKALLVLRLAGRILKAATKIVLTFLTRSAIAGGSLYFTAPFLILLVFSADIDRIATGKTLVKRQGLIQQEKEKRREVENWYSTEIKNKDAYCTQLGERYQSEVAGEKGEGLSGKYGEGPASAVAEKRWNDCVMELEELENKKAQELMAFDEKLGFLYNGTEEDISIRYGVEFPTNSFTERYAIVQELGKNPNGVFARGEMTIKAFLAFIFAALMLMKLMQPESIGIYLSSAMHDAFQRYQDGAFNERLGETKKPDGRTPRMTPHEFKRWWLSEYVSIVRDEEKYRALDQLKEECARKIEPLDKQCNAIESNIVKLETRLSQIEKDLQESQVRHAEVVAKLERGRGAYQDSLEEKEALERSIRNATTHGHGEEFVSGIAAAEKKLNELGSSIKRDEAESETLANRIGRLETERQGCIERLIHQRSEYEGNQRTIEAIRKKLREFLDPGNNPK